MQRINFKSFKKTKLTGLVSLLSVSLMSCTPSNEPSLENTSNESSEKRPNIIFIMADDLGYGDLGVYGQKHIKTPNIDNLAKEGMRFTQHYAGSTVCGPSRTSFFTGLHTGNSPIRENPLWTASGNPVEISQDDVMVQEVLQSAGYQTAIIGKWGLADRLEYNELAMPNRNGFDYSFVYKTHKDAHHYYWDTLYKNDEKFVIEGNDYWTNTGKYTHDLFTAEAINYVSNVNKDKPFFLFLAYTIPHLSMTVPEESKEPYKNLGWPERPMKNSNKEGSYRHDAEGNTAYAGMVSRMDRDIGTLVEKIEELGIDENTLIIFTSDNGHQFDRVKDEFFNSNGDLRGKKRDLYEGGIRVPMIARWPNTIEANSTSHHISSFWDFMSTACDLADTTCPNNDGISYLPELVGSKQEKHNFLYWEFNEKQGPIQAIRKDNWKLVRFLGKAPELYDLDNDISEENNLASAHPEVIEKLLPLLENARTPHPEFPLRKLN